MVKSKWVISLVLQIWIQILVLKDAILMGEILHFQPILDQALDLKAPSRLIFLYLSNLMAILNLICYSILVFNLSFILL